MTFERTYQRQATAVFCPLMSKWTGLQCIVEAQSGKVKKNIIHY